MHKVKAIIHTKFIHKNHSYNISFLQKENMLTGHPSDIKRNSLRKI